MAAQTPITQWVYQNRSFFNPRMVDFVWPKQFGLGIFDVETTIQFEGQDYVGRGAASTLLLAIEKSCAEALERIVCLHNGISSEGVALHSSLEAAKTGAIYEAQERFLFKRNLDNRFKLEELPMSLDEAQYSLSQGTLRRFHLAAPSQCLSCLSVFEVSERLFMGLSVDRTQEAAILKADLEGLRNVSAYLNNKKAFLSEIENRNDLWCCDNNLIKNLLSGDVMIHPQSLKLPIFETRQLKLPSYQEFASAPIYVVQAFKGEV